MSYIRLSDAVYPVSEGALRADNPNVSYPIPMPDSVPGYERVIDIAQPAFNAITQTCTEAAPALVNGTWTQQWQITDLPAEQAAANYARAAQQLTDSIVQATQDRLDAFARTRNYDGILSACTYATDPNARFAAEGQYCVNARSQTWQALYAGLAEVQAGTRAMPQSFDDVTPYLPVLEWPGA